MSSSLWVIPIGLVNKHDNFIHKIAGCVSSQICEGLPLHKTNHIFTDSSQMGPTIFFMGPTQRYPCSHRNRCRHVYRRLNHCHRSQISTIKCQVTPPCDVQAVPVSYPLTSFPTYCATCEITPETMSNAFRMGTPSTQSWEAARWSA